MRKNLATILIEALKNSSVTVQLCLDEKFNYIFANQGYANVYEKEISFFEGKNYFKLFPNKLLKEVFSNVLQSKSPFTLKAKPFQFTDVNNYQRLWNWHIEPFALHSESCLLITMEDVSQQIRYQELEIAHEDRYKNLFERSLSGLYQRSLDGVVISCNNAYARIFGFASKEEMLGKNINNLVTINSKESIALWADLVEGKLQSKETTFQIKDGTQKWVLESGAIINGESYESSLVEGSMIDITQSKLASREILEKQEKIADLQSQMLSAQMNPHFIFNAVNSITGYIVEEDIENAMIYTVDFADLMRLVLENSVRGFISVREEIDFLKRYTELERMRMKKGFDFTFSIPDHIDQDKVYLPPMLIQPFLENAIIHGISGKEYGKIKISFEMVDKISLRCKVLDNGPGIIEKPKRSVKERKSLGVSITDNRLKLFNKEQTNYGVNIHNIKDEEGKVKGACASVLIPIKSEK
ncbi:MAG: histidine kinase [Crocinitomicaceae bacterium]